MNNASISSLSSSIETDPDRQARIRRIDAELTGFDNDSISI